MTAALGLVAVAILVLLAVSAVFSAAETSLTGASKARMHQLEREGDKAAARVNLLIDDQERMIGSILLGNNLLNILSSALITETVSHEFPGGWGVVISTVITTALVLVFVEVLPKTLAISRPDDVARALSTPTLIVKAVFGPVIGAIQVVVRLTLRLFGVRLGSDYDAALAQEEIRGTVEYHHSEGFVEERDRRMLGGVLDLADMDVTQVMVHRSAITFLDADLPPRTLVAAALDSSHTRMPLYRGEPDNIVGVLHGKDSGAGDRGRRRGPGPAGRSPHVSRPPWFIPDTTNLKDQLDAFLTTRNHFALIVDEYGALQGLVTLEDILEEIVGEIEDEHDTADRGPAPPPPTGRWRWTAR